MIDVKQEIIVAGTIGKLNEIVHCGLTCML